MALSPADWGDEDGDDEIYFFFTETSRAFDSYERIKVPRVARVCAVRPLFQLFVLFCSACSVFSSLGLSLCLSSVSFFPLSQLLFWELGECGERLWPFTPIITLMTDYPREVDWWRGQRQELLRASPGFKSWLHQFLPL